MLAVARQRAVTGAGQSARDLALLTLLAHNGLCIGETLAADIEDLGTERSHRILRITRKGGRRAVVVLVPVTARGDMAEDALELVEAQADEHAGEVKQHPGLGVQGISSALLGAKLWRPR